MSTIKSGARHALRRIREIVSDMNYAQRRVVEIKFGIPPEEDPSSRRAREEIEELDALFELEPETADAENPA
jgi:hypothetical protein